MSLCLFPLFLSCKNLSLNLRPILLQDNFILGVFNYICKDSFSKLRSHSQVLGGHILGETTIQPIAGTYYELGIVLWGQDTSVQKM